MTLKMDNKTTSLNPPPMNKKTIAILITLAISLLANAYLLFTHGMINLYSERHLTKLTPEDLKKGVNCQTQIFSHISNGINSDSLMDLYGTIGQGPDEKSAFTLTLTNDNKLLKKSNLYDNEIEFETHTDFKGIYGTLEPSKTKPFISSKAKHFIFLDTNFGEFRHIVMNFYEGDGMHMSRGFCQKQDLNI